MDILRAGFLAGDLMVKHGMFIAGWTFVWDNAKRRFGQCRHGSKTIRVSRVLTELNSEEEFVDTVLHEIAHAKHGNCSRKQSHGYRWQAIAKSIGARPIRCHGSDVIEPTPKYIGTCLGCQVQVKRFKLTRRVREQSFHSRCARQHKESRIEWRKV
jgi:predicted SprT family Zn-dependent metalloprotease